MKLHVMSVAYERPLPMRILIDCFLVQTNPHWTLTVIHDGVGSKAVREVGHSYNDSRIRYHESFNRHGEFGHPNRQRFLKSFQCDAIDYILLTNDDNYYVPVFVDCVLGKCNDTVGMVYYNAVHSHFSYDMLCSEVKVDRIDIGSFVVRADVAKAVGFNNFAFNGDGQYACECAKYCGEHGLSVVNIPKPYFVHN